MGSYKDLWKERITKVNNCYNYFSTKMKTLKNNLYEKEPKTSKIFHASVAFANGAMVSTGLLYWLFKPESRDFNKVAITSAVVFGIANLSRNLFIEKEQNKKDMNSFLKGVPFGAIPTYVLIGLSLESTVVGLTTGLISVLITRKLH